MKLSVVIVNRNTCALLRKAIEALVESCSNFDYELFIVDNASVDGSVDMVANHFPQVNLLVNETDHGIARANNQALQLATGEYVLMVSADTISGNDSIGKMISFMDEHPDAAGVAPRILTPQGRFLAESIHGLSKTWAAYLKFIGFAKNLTKTRLYDRHSKGWVDEFHVLETDILNGACMVMRKSAINATGLFDERFFKYGYNIDLSYRLRLAGFKNYYFPKTFMINFEAGNREKLSWDYVRYTFSAMAVFTLKYLLRLPKIKIQRIAEFAPSVYQVK